MEYSSTMSDPDVYKGLHKDPISGDYRVNPGYGYRQTAIRSHETYLNKKIISGYRPRQSRTKQRQSGRSEVINIQTAGYFSGGSSVWGHPQAGRQSKNYELARTIRLSHAHDPLRPRGGQHRRVHGAGG